MYGVSGAVQDACVNIPVSAACTAMLIRCYAETYAAPLQWLGSKHMDAAATR